MIQKHINLLGLEVEDKITKFKGVVSSLRFDLYGCILVCITPSSDKGTVKESYWVDILRIKVLGKKPVLKRPDFIKNYSPQAKGKQGCMENKRIKL